MNRALPLAFLLPILAACPFGGSGPTTCTTSVLSALESATGIARPTDAGTLIAISWPAPTSPMPPGYFNRVRVAQSQPTPTRFTVTSDAGAEAEFAHSDGGFSFTVVFREPDRLAANDACGEKHGGMDDAIELEVVVSAPTDAGTRTVSTSASIQLGAF